MSIWKKEGDAFLPIKYGPFRSAFVVCQGPSFSRIDASKLCGPGRVVIGVNNVYPELRPDIWIGMDDTGCYEQRLFWEPFPKIMRGGYQKLPYAGATLGDIPNTFFADVEKGGGMWRYQKDGKFAWCNDTFRIALQFALSTGCTEIHLIGVDLTNVSKDYADDTELSVGQREYNQRLYNEQRDSLRKFAAQARWRGIQVASCSAESCINDFLHFSPVEEVIEGIEARMLSGRPRRHVLESVTSVD